MSINTAGFNPFSNRQKRLQLQNALARDPNTFKNQTAFRLMERKYKQRVPTPDFSTLLNFHNIASIPVEYQDKIVPVEFKKSLFEISPLFGSDISNSEEGGLKRVPGSYAYTIKGFPGLIIIPNPFSVKEQRNFIKRSLREFTKPPYISNLNTHYIIPANGIWDLCEQEFKGLISPESKEFFVSLKLNPSEVKKGSKEATSIETSSATKGYSYNGLNDSGEAIKNSHLKELSPSSLFKRMRWITFGYQYHWPTKEYILEENHFVPDHLAELSKAVVEAIDGVPFYSEEGDITFVNSHSPSRYFPEGGVYNFYQPKDSLMGHIDKSEPNLEAPLISFSFGLDGVFLIGGKDQTEEPIPILLKSGDIVAMCGPCRKAYHGVPRIIEDSLPAFLTEELESSFETTAENRDWEIFAKFLSTTRINANVRQVF